MVWLSLGMRLIVNVEALNMAEAVGNFTRHRKAGIVLRTQSGYIVRFTPTVSGESMAHAYQSWISRIAQARGLPVCKFCRREEFIKHAQPTLFGDETWEQELVKILGSKNTYTPEEVEKKIIGNCAVEDIGGFLIAAKIPVKRTSRFICGYMVPALDAIEKAVVEPQMHIRHTPSLIAQDAQKIFIVEVGSAVYSWSFALDLHSIGRSSYTGEPVLDSSKTTNRIELAIDALAHMLETKIFGAKLSRFNPVIDYESILVVMSRNTPFNVSSPARESYIEDTVKRVNALSNRFKYEFKVIGYAGYSDIVEKMAGLRIETSTTVVDALARAREVYSQWLQQSQKS